MVYCEVCGFEAKNEHGLQIHKSKKHKEPEIITSEPLELSSGDNITSNTESSTVTTNNTSLNNDIPIDTIHDEDKHSNKTDAIYKCDFCDKTFKTERGKKLHQTKSHGKNSSMPRQKDNTKELPATHTSPCLPTLRDNLESFAKPSDSSAPLDTPDNSTGSPNMANDTTLIYSQTDAKEEPQNVQENRESGKETSYQCDYCPRSFQTLRGKRQHQTKTHGKKQLPENQDKINIEKKDNEERTQNISCPSNSQKDHQVVRANSVLESSTNDIPESNEDNNASGGSNDDKWYPPLWQQQDACYQCEYCGLVFDTDKSMVFHNLKAHSEKIVDAILGAQSHLLRQEVKHVQFEQKFQSKDDTIIVFRPQKDVPSPGQLEYQSKDSKHGSWHKRQGPEDRIARQINENKLQKAEVSLVKSVVNYLMDNFMTELKKISPEFGWAHFRSGSYYDKTKNGQPDEFDIMIYPRDIIVEVDFNSSSQIPGFYKVKLMSKRAPDIFKHIVDDNDYILPSKFKKYVFGLFDQTFETIREGRRIKKKVRSDDSSPAYTFDYSTIPMRQDIDIDFVPCFRLEGWPPIAKRVDPKWIKCNKIVIDALKCYDVVCKTCPDDVNDKDLLWRLSFSAAEKKLITHANDGNKYSSRKTAFKMFKGYVEDVKKKNPDQVKKFCSYHLKQFMLHQFDKWIEVGRLSIQCSLIEDLIGKLTSSPPYIENYFIKNDNVVRYVPDHEINLVVEKLKEEIKHLQSKTKLI